jgi:hypothetical protein
MSKSHKASSSQVKRIVGSGKQASVSERLEKLIAHHENYKLQPGTLAILEHIWTHAQKTGSASFMIQATVEIIAFLEHNIILNVQFDGRTKTKLFGKDAVFEDELSFRTPWRIYNEKVQFSVKVARPIYLECLPGVVDGVDVPDRDFVLPAKVMMNVKFQPYMDFPTPGSAGMTLSLAQELELVPEEEAKPIKKRKPAAKEENKKSKKTKVEYASSEEDDS